MKLIVQIPCFNEEATLAQTVADIPRQIDGVHEVEILIIDDGSADRTVETARRCGVDHVIRHKRNCGLGRSFRTGIDACLRLGADVIVNTDGDNQYFGADIPKLIEPVLSGDADVVIGDRQTWNVAHFSNHKKILQAVGSIVVRKVSGTNVPDAVSGFRAFSRQAALQMNVLSPFSYTIETIVQAERKRLAVTSVPVGTNGKARESRLFRSVPEFIARSLVILVRTYAMYQPLRVFFYVSMILSLIGIVPIGRFLWFFALGNGEGHVQSLVLGGAALLMGFLALMIGLLADVISCNRQLIETVLEKVRRLELADKETPGDVPDRKATRGLTNKGPQPHVRV